jgi:UDP-N-acetylglucosamine 2-epimerase
MQAEQGRRSGHDGAIQNHPWEVVRLPDPTESPPPSSPPADAPRIVLAIGTRPDTIKMAPVYRALAAAKRTHPLLLSTGQHRELLDQTLREVSLTPDRDLGLMRADSSQAKLLGRTVAAVYDAIREMQPNAVLIHGDTTSALASALAAFYARVPVGHVEAGLRTYDFDAPWPEEMNRRLVAPITRWCFAPTAHAAQNLVQREGIPADRVYVVGNTVIDALMEARRRLAAAAPAERAVDEYVAHGQRLILVTGHRRESFGGPLEQLCLALRDAVQQHPDAVVVFPVHLNPRVRGPVYRALDGCERIRLIEPVGYLKFVALMERADLIVTDSGGIQEEASALDAQILVTRRVTERPEALEQGRAILVPASREKLAAEIARGLDRRRRQRGRSDNVSPFGDGRAGERIAYILARTLAEQEKDSADPCASHS